MTVRVVVTIAGLTPESGGPSRSVPALAEALAKSGADVDIVALDFGQKESAPLIPAAPVRTHLIPCRGSRRIPTLWAHRFRSKLARSI